MKRILAVAIGTLSLCGCTGTHLKKLPVCDGNHRRPANAYGTVLPTLPVPEPASVKVGPARPQSSASGVSTGGEAHHEENPQKGLLKQLLGPDDSVAVPDIVPHTSQADSTAKFRSC